jgi:hypothetical protein
MMKEQIDELLKSKDLKDITRDIVEKVLDSQITDEVLKEIPVVKSLVAVRNIFTSISDRIFIKKAMNVLLELGEVDWEQRAALTSELNDNNCTGAEKILMAIDRLETIEKCKVYGRLCRLKALNKISVNGFLRLTKVIQDAYLEDLLLIKDFKQDQKEEVMEGDYYSIILLGLLYQERTEQAEIRVNHNRYHANEPEITGGEINFYFLLSNTGKTLLEHYDYLFPPQEQ